MLKGLRDAVARDRQLAADDELKKELDDLEKASVAPARPGSKPDLTIADSLRFDQPIAFNPEFRRDLQAARIFRLSDATGLGDATAKVLIDNVGTLADITDDRLRGW